eukprot:542359_1
MRRSVVVLPITQLFRLYKPSFCTKMANAQLGKLYSSNIPNRDGACRFIIYTKGIEDRIEFCKGSALGGVGSESYKEHEEAVCPSLVLNNGYSIRESDTIARYLIDAFPDVGPKFTPSDPELRAKANSIARIFDCHLHSIQGCTYGKSPPFGSLLTRTCAVDEMVNTLRKMDGLIDDAGPYLIGPSPSIADAIVFPSMVFYMRTLAKFGHKRAEYMGDRMEHWFEFISNTPSGHRVATEIQETTSKMDREGILGPRIKDTAPATLFDKILAKEIPSTAVYEDDLVYAFKDINPVARFHCLVIPKHRDGLTQLRYGTTEHTAILGKMLQVSAKLIADNLEGEGARIIINDGKQGCQEVFHLHIHVIGGRQLGWPPG